jgi:hypothetical protein
MADSPTEQDVELSLLALDAYMRGDDPGIDITAKTIGDATFQKAQFNLDVDNGRSEPSISLHPALNAACSVS